MSSLIPVLITGLATGIATTAGAALVEGGLKWISKLSQRNTNRSRVTKYDFTDDAMNHLPAKIRDPSFRNELNKRYQKKYQPQEAQADEEDNEPN